MEYIYIKINSEKRKAKKIYKLEYMDCYKKAYINYRDGVNITKFHPHDYIENNSFYKRNECIYYIINKLESADFIDKVLLENNDILIIHKNTVVEDIKNSEYEKKKENEIMEFLKNKQLESTEYINNHSDF